MKLPPAVHSSLSVDNFDAWNSSKPRDNRVVSVAYTCTMHLHMTGHERHHQRTETNTKNLTEDFVGLATALSCDLELRTTALQELLILGNLKDTLADMI